MVPGRPPPPARPSFPDRPVPSLDRRPHRGPSFAIVRLHPGASAQLHTAPGGRPLVVTGPQSEFGSPVVLGVVRRQGSWLGVGSPQLANGSLGWLRLDPSLMRLYWTKYSLHVDVSARSLELRYGAKPIDRYPVTVGGPGSETPTGRFAVTDALSFDDSPFYGCCALALSGHQPHLPLGWLGGDRIAIHGTAGPVGQAESLGCIRATDATIRFLLDRVPLGVPVFVSA